MKCADSKYLLKEAQRTLDESDSTSAFCLCQRWILKDALSLLKEQEEQIKNRDESLEKAREEIKWLRGMLKE